MTQQEDRQRKIKSAIAAYLSRRSGKAEQSHFEKVLLKYQEADNTAEKERFYGRTKND
jgi:hypothetical protein